MHNTRQHIIEAAIEVFNQDLSAPLEKVAEKAGITRRTLHRHFRDRGELVELCQMDMQQSCSKAIKAALDGTDDPLLQLQRMLHAGVDCGAKYSFFYKIHQRAVGSQQPSGPMYDRLRKVILQLQDSGHVSRLVTPEWIYTLFSAVVIATVNAASTGTADKASLKQYAWYSFSKGIGI